MQKLMGLPSSVAPDPGPMAPAGALAGALAGAATVVAQLVVVVVAAVNDHGKLA